jgi:thiol-disulfide isomerase/thioredoxin
MGSQHLNGELEQIIEGFGDVVDEYERGRPGYASEAIDLIVEDFSIRPHSRLLDVGAGTGKLTKQLVETGANVVALEPVAAMRHRLAANLREVEVVEGLRSNGAGRPHAALVEFVSPYCFECREALPLLKAAAKVYEAPLAVIDAKERPELANKYSIRHTPTILVVDSRGSVRGGWLGVPPEHELEAALATAGRVAAA